MIRTVEFYFDFISPYSYLAHKRIRYLEKKEKIKFLYKPIYLGGLHKLIGITASAFITPKAKFMIRDCKLWAEKNKTSFKFNSYFPIKSLELMRGVLQAEKENKVNKYIDKFFDAMWKDGLNLNNQSVINKILISLNINPENFYLNISRQPIKDELKKKTNDALLKGIFGAPSFIINNKMFWGQDRLHFVMEEARKN